MEEKEILEQEMHRTVKHFSFMSGVWRQMGEECITDRPGSAAYAYKQAAMFKQFEDDICKKQQLAQAKQAEFDAWRLEYRVPAVDSSASEEL